MTRLAFVPLGLAALLPAVAGAFPDGAPWTALDDPTQGCASCHFGAEPVAQSEALTIEGVDRPLSPGETYAITLRFAPQDAERMGFLATFAQAQSEGARIVAGDGLEAHETAVRSIVTASPFSEGAVWTFDWTTSATPGPVIMHVAAVAANDDASPFGDAVHLKTISFDVVGEP